MNKTNKINKKLDKKAVSLMLAYVILIAVGIGLSIAVYTWLKTVSNVNPVSDCNEGTSVILDNSICDGETINLTLRNNGRFNVAGVLVSFGNDTRKTPVDYLPPTNSAGEEHNGIFFFNPEFEPGTIREASFERGDASFKYIRMIQIQPFILSKKEKVFCSESIIKQQIPDCSINNEL